jgi:hypothetical protein
MESPRFRSGVTAWQPGDRIGPWTLSHVLGTGYSGEVWAARDSEFRFAAVKVRRDHGEPGEIDRFEREIVFMRAHRGHFGTLPIENDGGQAELSLPAANDTPRWYSMPIATPVDLGLPNSPSRPIGSGADLTAAYCQWSATLADFHQRGWAHCDIKPPHLFHHAGRWVIGDWGLAHLLAPTAGGAPAHLFRTFGGEAVAPEQRVGDGACDPAAVDVYRLAASVRLLAKAIGVPPAIDDLLAKSTRTQPDLRPTMAEVRDHLAAVTGENR